MRRFAAAVLAGLLVLAGAPASAVAGSGQPGGIECDMACCKRPGGGMGGHSAASGSAAAAGMGATMASAGAGHGGGAGSILCGWSCSGKRRFAGVSVEAMPSLLPAPARLAAPGWGAGARPGLDTLSSLPPPDRPERPPRA
jgi:hypothetical protein